MALPPLELFSLEKKPPCCRVAFSRWRGTWGAWSRQSNRRPISPKRHERWNCGYSHIGSLWRRDRRVQFVGMRDKFLLRGTTQTNGEWKAAGCPLSLPCGSMHNPLERHNRSSTTSLGPSSRENGRAATMCSRQHVYESSEFIGT